MFGHGALEPLRRFWRIGEGVKKCPAITFGERECFVFRDGAARGLGKRRQAIVGELAAFEMSRAL